MFQTLIKLHQILVPNEKKSLYFVIFVVFIIGVFEIFGIASIIPIISVMDNPEVLNTNKYFFIFKKFLNDLGFEETAEILVILGLTSFFMIFLSTILRALGIFITTRFIEMRRHHISLRLFASYLKNNYQFFIDTNSTELTKIILSKSIGLLRSLFDQS